jgi:hypothetical protein
MSVNQSSSGVLQIIRHGRFRAGALSCVLSLAAIAACGGSEDVVRAPQATKVVWGGGEASAEAPSGEEAASESAKQEERDEVAEPAAKPAPKAKPPEAAPPASEDSEEAAALAAGAIDLDAPPAAPARAAEDAPAPKAREKKGRASKERASKERATKERASKDKVAAAPAADEREKEAPAPEPPAAEPSPDAPPPLAELQRRRNQREKAEAKNEKETPKEKPSEAPERAAPAYKGAEPCRAASFTIERVRTACENGGRPGAKRVMKEAINKAVATGKLLKCGDCHSSTSDYTLKPDAVDKLQSWLN